MAASAPASLLRRAPPGTHPRRSWGTAFLFLCLGAWASAPTAGEGTDGAAPETVPSLTRLAVQKLLRESRYDEAETLSRRLLAEVESTLGPHSIEAAYALDLLVEALWRAGKGSDAASLDLARRALTIKEALLGSEHVEVARSALNLGYVLQLSGDYGEARRLFERSLAIRERALGPEYPDVSESLLSLADLLSTVGEGAAARPLYERALSIREKAFGPQDAAVAECLDRLSFLLMGLGDYVGARPLAERALAIRMKALGPDHADVAASLKTLGVLLDNLGDYPAAKGMYERALAIWEKTLGPEDPNVARVLGNLGVVMEDMGDYEQAKSIQERALALREKIYGPAGYEVALNLSNLASLLGRMGRYGEAKPIQQRALAIREKLLGPDHAQVAWSLKSLAEILQNLGDDAEAKSLLARSLEILEKEFGPDHPAVAEVHVSLAGALWRSGQTEGAVGEALRAEEIGRNHVRLTAQTLAEAEALRYASTRVSGLDVAISLAAQGIEPVSRTRTWDALIHSRALVLDEMAARQRTVVTADDPEISRLASELRKARERLAALVVKAPPVDSQEPYRELLEQARLQKGRAERDLAERSAAFRKELKRGLIGLEEVTRLLPEGSGLLGYVLYNRIEKGSPGNLPHSVPSYLAWVVKRGASEPAAVPLGPAGEIDSLVGRWRDVVGSEPSSFQPAGRKDEARYRQRGERLRRAIWDPVAERLRGLRLVFVVPDGALNLVSLATLPVGGKLYLLENDPAFHYLSAERDLGRADMAETRGQGLLAFGGPDFDARPQVVPRTSRFRPTSPETRPATPKGDAKAVYRGARSDCGDLRSLRFGRLPATRTEVSQIADLWRRHRSLPSEPEEVLALVGPEATETAFKEMAPGHRILHLATHGFFLPDHCSSRPNKSSRFPPGGPDSSASALEENPLLRSGLAFAGANLRENPTPGEVDDGILTAEEIASLDLSGVEWVVLSACNTGLGELQAGEGVLGLKRAFEMAGAGTLIMSLWRVEDQATRDWMTRLYESRLSGLSTTEAIRRASLQILAARRRANKNTHPFYWGAFIAGGDWR